MRFAWLKKKTGLDSAVKPGCGTQLIRQIYNAFWWIPIVLALVGSIEYSTAFIAFTAVTVTRLIANLYLNNALDVERAETFPFRA